MHNPKLNRSQKHLVQCKYNKKPLIKYPQLCNSPYNHVGHNFSYYYNYGVKLDTCNNIYLKNCTFIASKVEIFAVSGVKHIDQVNFLSSAYRNDGDITSMFTVLTEANMMNDVTVRITKSLFTTMGNKGLLLFYVYADNPYADELFNILIEDTNFTHLSYDPGLKTESIMQIRLSTYVYQCYT